MTLAWETRKVMQLQQTGVLLVEDGNHGEYRPRPDEFSNHGHRFIRAADIEVDRVRFETASAINEIALARIRKGIGRPGDVLFSHKGTVGKVALVPDDAPPFVCSPQTTFWRVLQPDVLDRRYLHAFMRSRTFANQWLVRKGETDMADYVSLTAQRSLEVALPPLVVQRRIAAAVAAYDELIENNLRRIEITEEMAQAVYREWFVEFRFPGHEDVAMVESELAPIPEGWEASNVGAAFQILGGATPSTKKPEFWESGSINWYTPSDLTSHGQMFVEQSSRQITPRGLAGSSATLFPAGSVMMTSRATLGVVAINAAEACTNQGFITCLPNRRVSRYHLYFWLRQNRGVIESLATGATFKEITKRAFREIAFLVPPEPAAVAFNERVEPMLSLAHNLIRQNANLRATRDLLLPKLVSGQIDVSDLDIDTDWLVA